MVSTLAKDHRELGSISQYEDLHLDSTVTIARFQIGDVACFYPEVNNPDRTLCLCHC